MTNKADMVRWYIDAYSSGETPSCEDIQRFFPQYTVHQVHEFFQSPRIYNYLLDFDIPLPPKTRSRKSLTDQQRKWLQLCTNPYTTKKLAHLCSEFGITQATHAKWMNQAHFAKEYKRLMALNLAGSEGEVVRRVASKAIDTGDIKSVETFYRMANKPLPATLSSAEAQGMVPLEAVIKAMQEICSAEQLAAISIKLLSGPSPDAPLELPEST